MTRTHRVVWLAAVLATASCADEPASPGPDVLVDTHGPSTLVDPAAWVATPPADDPLRDHAPDGAACGAGAWTITSDGALDVDTGACAYLAVEQPALSSVAAGEDLHLLIWHLELFALEPAEAHVAVLAGDRVLWERTVAIPSDAAVYDETVPVVEAIPEGTPIRLHLHNHGTNEWRLAPIERVEGR